MIHVVLFEPEIAENAGNVARSCVAAGARLHLVRPLGFRLDAARLRRAGMDYWNDVDVTVHAGFEAFREAFADEFARGRVFALSTKGRESYADVRYGEGDVLLFGPESRGLPDAVREAGRPVVIPMRPGVRSLNLASSVAIVLYEAWRQREFR